MLATGILGKPTRQVNVGAQVSGQLKKRYVKPGDRVAQGQSIGRDRSALQPANCASRRPNYAAHQAQKLASRAELKQYQLG